MRHVLSLSLVAGFALASVALAQPPKNDRPQRGKGHASDVLSGPKVGDRPVDLEGSGEMRRERPAANELMKARLFQRALDSLRSDQAGEDKITGEQDAQIKELRSAFEKQLREYREQHRDETRQLLAQLPPAQRERAQRALAGPEGARGRGPGGEGRGGEGPGENERARRREGRPGPGGPDGARRDAEGMDAPDRATPEQAEKAQARLRELAEGAPKPDETHAKILAVLSESQRQKVGAEIERLRGESAERRDREMGEQRARRAVRETDKGEGEGPAGPGGGAGDRAWLRDVPREELRGLRDLPPDERRAALEALRAKYAKPQPK